MLVSTIITRVREALHDVAGAVYLDKEALYAYNRAVEETQQLLIMVGARVALNRESLTGDGTNYQFTLPGTCLGITPGTLRGRSPSSATTNYSHGPEITLVDDTNSSFVAAPTTVGVPTCARLDVSAMPIVLSFNCIPTSGDKYDYSYIPQISEVADIDIAGSTDTPWNGLLDRVIRRGMEVILRAGAEYTGEPREKWLMEARAAAVQLLGMHVHQRQEYVPSTFRGGAWTR